MEKYNAFVHACVEVNRISQYRSAIFLSTKCTAKCTFSGSHIERVSLNRCFYSLLRRFMIKMTDRDMRTPDSDSPAPDVRFSQLSVLRGHTKSVASVKFGGNGLLVTASADKSVRIWDLTEGRQVQVLRGHTQGVSDASWSKQGNHIASASDDNMVKLWDAESGKCLRTLQGHTNYVFCCTFSPEGNLLVSRRPFPLRPQHSLCLGQRTSLRSLARARERVDLFVGPHSVQG